MKQSYQGFFIDCFKASPGVETSKVIYSIQRLDDDKYLEIGEYECYWSVKEAMGECKLTVDDYLEHPEEYLL